jgi:hypothetical protein
MNTAGVGLVGLTNNAERFVQGCTNCAGLLCAGAHGLCGIVTTRVLRWYRWFGWGDKGVRGAGILSEIRYGEKKGFGGVGYGWDVMVARW